jgi:hypothetical protein
MVKITQANWFIGITSLIPGLGIILLGKRRLGLYVTLAIGLFLIVFCLAPNLITWFIFGIAFIAQMAYAIGLATIRATKVETTIDSNLAYPMPARFSDKKQIAAEVIKSLSEILGTDEVLKTAIIGMDQDTNHYMFVGVTQAYLILSQCSHAGNPSDPQRIAIGDVSWVNLEIGERNLLLTIEYDGGKKLILHILGKLNKQAVLIVDEFPGTWSSKSFLDGYKSVQKENNRFSAIIIYVTCIILFAAGAFLTDGLPKPFNQIVLFLITAVLLFIMSWPQFISIVRRLKKEPGITSTNVISFFPMIMVLFLWSFSLFTIGEIIIPIAQALFSTAAG